MSNDPFNTDALSFGLSFDGFDSPKEEAHEDDMDLDKHHVVSGGG